MGFVLPKREIELFGGAVSPRQEELLTTYGERVVAAPRAINVVSGAALERLGEHFVDSAAVLSVVEVRDQRVVDLGSGGGFPGLVVAILRPSARVTLVDSRRSKATFLKGVQRELRLQNLEIVHGRLEDLEGARLFDVGLSRALGAVERSLGASLRLLGDGGRLVLFKGPRWGDEAAVAATIAGSEGAALERTVTVDLPGHGRSTTFVVFHVKRSDR